MLRCDSVVNFRVEMAWRQSEMEVASSIGYGKWRDNARLRENQSDVKRLGHGRNAPVTSE
jgi:hypothetical protein